MAIPADYHNEPTPRLLIITQAAEFLGSSRANVFGLIDVGELSVIAIGKLNGHSGLSEASNDVNYSNQQMINSSDHVTIMLCAQRKDGG